MSAPAAFNIIPSLEGHRLRVGTAQSRIELCSIKTVAKTTSTTTTRVSVLPALQLLHGGWQSHGGRLGVTPLLGLVSGSHREGV